MKKAVINTWFPYLFLLLATSVYGCGSRGDGSKGVPSPPRTQTQTEIDYVINLDEARKTKEEEKKIYYEVPLGKKVSILAKVTGPPTVDIDWEQNPRFPLATHVKRTASQWQSSHHEVKINGKVVVEEDTGRMHSAWELASMTPICLTVTGKPHRIGQVPEQGDHIINDEKVFVITWRT